MGNIDFTLIANRALSQSLSILQRLFPLGRLEGHEYRVGGLDGSAPKNKGSLSINVNTGQWSDFSTGDKGGDLISLLAAKDGMNQKDAAEEISMLLGDELPVDNLQERRPEKIFTPDFNPPSDPPSHNHYRHQKPDATWVYKNLSGQRMFYIHRFNVGDGKKEICPQVYGSYDGKIGWFWKQVKDNRPVYGLDRLASGKGTVLIVEGEKCADALHKISGGKIPAISWCGGTNAVDRTDWSCLKGRKVVIWPDADQKTYKGNDKVKPLIEQPGYKAALNVSIAALKAGADDVVILDFNYIGHPDGWDVADAVDEGWNLPKIIGFIKEGIESAQKKEPNEPDATPEDKVKKKEELVTLGLESLPFQCLGYDHGVCFYNPFQTQQLKAMTESSHTKQNLFYMAELKDWKKAFPSSNRPFWDIDEAMSAMMKACRNKGTFSMENVRGRGAWLDVGRVILHLGDRLMVDGVLTDELLLENSQYYYELKMGFSPPSDEYISSKEAQELLDIFYKLRWSNPISGLLALGWCIMAPFCGAFSWRPHIWMNGPAGAGKTWIQDNMINKLVGDYALMATSVTTEAGIRSALKGDARPVILDEFEAQDAKGVARSQNIMELMRQSSSESEAKIIKGTAGGGSVNYRIRSSFCLSSIGLNIPQYADQSRISVLGLDAPEKYETDKIEEERQNFKDVSEYCSTILTDKFVDKLHGRTVRFLKEITESVENGREAISKSLNNQRNGDQYGTLIAVALSWLEGRVVSIDEITEWTLMNNINNFVDGTIETDDRRCFDHLMDQSITVRSERKNMPYTFTVAQVVEALRFNINLFDSDWHTQKALGPTPDECVMTLSQCGIRLGGEKKEYILISNNHVWLSKIYKDTQWANAGWPGSLKQIEGADNYNGKAVRIGGMSRKCVRVPLPGKVED